MKILNCPLNGPRNISEFVCCGELKEMTAPADAPASFVSQKLSISPHGIFAHSMPRGPR